MKRFLLGLNEGFEKISQTIGSKIRNKIIISFLVLILLSMLIVTLFARNVITDGISQQGMLQVESSISVVKDLYEQMYIEGGEACLYARYLGVSREVRSYLADNEGVSLRFFVQNFQTNNPVSSATIARQDRWRFSHAGFFPDEAIPNITDLVDDIIAADDWIYLSMPVITKEGVVVFSGNPIQYYDEAVAIVSYYINHEYLKNIKDRIQADITILHEGKLIASSIEKKLILEGTEDYVVELPLEEFTLTRKDENQLKKLKPGEIYYTVKNLDLDEREKSQPYLVGLMILDPRLDDTYLAVSISRQPVLGALRQANMLLIGLFIVSLCVGIILAVVLSNIISRPIINLSHTASAIGDGDLRVQFSSIASDEVGILQRGFLTMVENLRELLGHIQSSSQRVSYSAEQLSSAAEQASAVTEEVTSTMEKIAVGTEEQAESVEQTSAIVEEVSASVDEVSSGAQVVSEASTIAKEKAGLGNEAVREVIDKMSTIKSSTYHSANIIRGLEVKTGEINEIIATIKEIIDQTNLLALNAAIEAARAGEYGRGFAVVAEQIKSLSDESKKAANRINSILTGIRTDTETAVKSMELNQEHVVIGEKVVQRAGEALTQIYEAIERTASVAQEIAAATQEQTAATEEIVKAMEKVSVISDQTAEGARMTAASTEEQQATVEDVFRAAEHLATMAEELREALARFKFLGE